VRFINRLAGLIAVAACALSRYSFAEMRGVTATESKIGQTMPYGGPVSAFGALGKGEVGYFKMVDERAAASTAQGQFDLAGRWLRAAENGGADAAAGGERRGGADLFLDRHRA
jgi:hypothetical protein